MDLSEVPAHPFVRHPWERARFDFFHRLLRDHAALGSARHVLDVGSGDAFFARELVDRLSRDTSITCFDLGYEQAGPMDEHPRIRYSHTRPEERFDLLLLLDVLEHVEDDATFLRELIRENAAQDARVLLTVPAWEILRTSHDDALGHHRRYSPHQLLALAKDAGLRPLSKGELFVSLVLPRAFSLLRERIVGANGASASLHWRHGETAARIVGSALALDAGICRTAAALGVPLLGLSTWVLCAPR